MRFGHNMHGLYSRTTSLFAVAMHVYSKVTGCASVVFLAVPYISQCMV